MAKNKALIVMDMIKVYIYGEKPLIPVEARSNLIANIKKAINLAHSKSIPVIYVNLALRKIDPIYKLINYQEQAMEGGKNIKIIDELKPKPQDYILKKRGYDAFWKSSLQTLLKKLKIRNIFLTGCQTDACVRETAVTAAHLGYCVYVLEDCCQTSREFGQMAALRFMRTCAAREIITLRDLHSRYFR